MASLIQIVARAEQIAVGRGTDPHKSPVSDAGMTTEALYPHALRCAIHMDLKNGGSPTDYEREHEISISDGVGDLPPSVLREFLGYSYLPEDPYAALVPYPDYRRTRFDTALSYYAIRDSQFYYSGEVLNEILVKGGVSVTQNSVSVSQLIGDFAPDAEDRRLRVETAGGVSLMDAFIGTAGADPITMLGQANATNTAAVAYLSNEVDYETVRSLTNVNTTVNDETVTCAGAAFTDDDIGRRLKITDSSVILDAFIVSINSSTSVEMSARATATSAIATGVVQLAAGTSIILNTPSLPETVDDPEEDLELLPKLENDVIIIMASALIGDMKLPELLTYN